MKRFQWFAVLYAITTLAGAQTTITNTVPAVLGYLDLTTNGGTAVVPSPSDDSEHNIVSARDHVAAGHVPHGIANSG